MWCSMEMLHTEIKNYATTVIYFRLWLQVFLGQKVGEMYKAEQKEKDLL